tara:strand:+ start:4261 stop:5370 length:1110 start_codon:yes stop_codon:yes gene_type:complete
MAHAAPADSMSLATLMVSMAERNTTLLDWIYPAKATLTSDFRRNWVPFTDGCRVATDCYCHHVEGDMSRAINPEGWKKCATLSSIGSCSPDGNNCNCLHGAKRDTPCLFSDMRPTKILAVITAARAAGVTHIVEEGRYGGLSALMYAWHGFDVTSIEFLPLTGATIALKQLAPNIRLLDGDGSKLLPEILGPLDAATAARTMVIFDGEKRFGAWKTYEKIKDKVAVAVFDDTNLEAREFRRMLDRTNQIWWQTSDPWFRDFLCREEAALELIAPLTQYRGRWMGGVNHLEVFDFAILRGGAWSGNERYTPAQSAHSTINQRKHADVANMCLLANGSSSDKFIPLRHYRQRQWRNWRDGKGFGKATGRGR